MPRRQLVYVLVPLVLASVAVGAAAPAQAVGGSRPAAGVAAGAAGTYQPFSPSRLLDTRSRTAQRAAAPLAPGHALLVQVTGSGPVPASGVGAVALTVTATGSAAGGWVSVYPGSQRPTTSNLNFAAHQTVANMVVVPVSAGGQISLYNGGSAPVDLIADLAGYFSNGSATSDGSAAAATPGTFGAVNPSRLLDTRARVGASGPVPANHQIAVSVLGRAGVPSGGVAAVILNVTATQAVGTGDVRVFGSGGTIPVTSNLNFLRGQTVPNLVIAPVGSDGKVAFRVDVNSAHLLADVQGYVLGAVPSISGALGSIQPARIVDSRYGLGIARAIPPGATAAVKVLGVGGVPASGVSAVAVNVTALPGAGGGRVTLWPHGTARPLASNLNFSPHQITPGLAVVAVGAGGLVDVVNASAAPLNLLLDVSGYVLGADLPTPVTSTSRYVRDISDGGSSDVSVMTAQGCSDAQANGSGNHLQVLDLGAQTVTSPLSATDPGVRLTQTATRIDYPALTRALQGYLDGLANCAAAGSAVTVAVGANSDGEFVSYPAAKKGTDWAALVSALGSPARPGISVVAAMDAESTFAATPTQVLQWYQSYLAGAPAAPSAPAQLLFIGSADGCPTTFGAVNQACARGWTQADYYRLATGASPGHVAALPQIYLREQADQWAGIARSRPSAGTPLDFAGVLTENTACPAGSGPPACPAGGSMVVGQGWSALSLAVNAAGQPAIGLLATDLRVS
jgi:hypothetical protein